MNTKNSYFSIDYKNSEMRLTFNSIPDKYENYALHYVIDHDDFYSTENVKYNYWYTRCDMVPLQFNYIRLYAFSLDTGVELIDEYKFNIADFNFMLNFKTDSLDEANIWSKYIDLYNKVHNTRIKYAVNIVDSNGDYDNWEISREKYNFIYGLSELDLSKIHSVDIIKKIVGNI